MTRSQYLQALKTLGLTPASKKTAEALGVSLSTCQRYASGAIKIPNTVAILLQLLTKGK